VLGVAGGGRTGGSEGAERFIMEGSPGELDEQPQNKTLETGGKMALEG